MVGFIGNGPVQDTFGDSNVYHLGQTSKGFYPPFRPSFANYTDETATQYLLCNSPAGESSPNSIYISPDGKNVYVTGSGGDLVLHWPLTSEYNLTTAGTRTSFSVSAQTTDPYSIYFADDPNDVSTYGKKMYISTYSTDTVHTYNLTQQWDISTASVDTSETWVFDQDRRWIAAPTSREIKFNKDGSKMFLLETGQSLFVECELTTKWDVSTASPVALGTYAPAYDLVPSQGFGCDLSRDGKTLYIVDFTYDKLSSLALPSAFRSGYLRPVYQTSSGLSGSSAPRSVFVSHNNQYFFIADSSGDRVERYSFG